MSAKAISEASGKIILNKFLENIISPCKLVSVDESTSFKDLIYSNEWLRNTSLVVKPDQLIKRRGKLNLVFADKNIKEIEDWVNVKIGKELKIDRAVGKLREFIIEPFIPHTREEEFYLCIYSIRDGDLILFHHEGGVDVGDVDSKALKLFVEVNSFPNEFKIIETLLKNVSSQKYKKIATFILNLYTVYVKLYFTYLEINPFICKDEIYIIDLAAKLDSTAEYICKREWGSVKFPPPFGRDAFPEEKYISDLDAKSGASLKLTILNKNGRIWIMVAGGGASVIYADTICQLGGTNELANYGEYSGAPSEQQTYEYAKTILSLMTSHKHPDGKILIIGGGIANFTNVASTFKGIVKALKEFQSQLIEHKASIFVRRAGPNYQEGLRSMRELGNTLGVPVHVFGPETHMTAIVSMAMGKRQIPNLPEPEATTANFLLVGHHDSTLNNNNNNAEAKVNLNNENLKNFEKEVVQNLNNLNSSDVKVSLFSVKTKAIIWGMQTRAVQNMLDFDYVCSRKEGSVVALIYPFTEDHKLKFYWGQKEIMIPVYKEMSNAINKHPHADVLINFASLRSAYDSTIKTLKFSQIRTIAIIAEGIPENLTRDMNKKAKELGVTIIGPATVGGIQPGCFKIGNTGGMMDNILLSNLYRPGSVAYVSRSGGMSNELNNIIARASNGVYEGIAIGGDRYPGTTFLDHLLRYQNNPHIKILVLLGEVGGVEEYRIVDAIKEKKITKPLVAWCIGTCSSMFTSEVQFGHAGSSANSESETAIAKNKALKDVGVIVPDSFDELGVAIKNVYDDLVSKGIIILKPEVAPPTVPMDYNWARELGLIRKPASFMTSICDERGNDLLYAGIPITNVIKENLGLGGTLGLLWFQRRLPVYANKFLEMCLMVTADHGPAVSGAHNTIVCARAGKDLVSSLVSGLLTIGDRFGGALDGAARQFSKNDFSNLYLK